MPGIFISLAISFLLFLYAPVDLYCANVSEFWFDFSTLLITALGMFAACFAVLTGLYLIAMLIHPYVYRIALAGGLTRPSGGANTIFSEKIHCFFGQ